MIKVGITGQPGFIGTHLFNFLGLKEEILRVPFKDEYFDNENRLDQFVMECDCIVHLAAVNRHSNPEIIYETNILLIKKLLESCNRSKSRPHIIFSSSIQEDEENLYGKSKKDGRQIFLNWAREFESRFTGLIIPNVFGPFGKPFHNSVIGTFCYQLTHEEVPEIKIDKELNLIYINELVYHIYKAIIKPPGNLSSNLSTMEIESTYTTAVSEILNTLKRFTKEYKEDGMIPTLSDKFELDLFNTFRCYFPDNFYPKKYLKHCDDRGEFVEIIRAKNQGQFSYSSTKPGITRGNHFHTRKFERFSVIKGEARIDLRKIGEDKIITYFLDGKNPAFVDIPVWYTHSITNIGNSELYTLFWINELYDPNDPDTYFENVKINEMAYVK